MHSHNLVGLAAAAGLVLAISPPTRGQTTEPPFRPTAFAGNMSNIASGGARTVDIAIDRWPTDDGRQRLIATRTPCSANYRS